MGEFKEKQLVNANDFHFIYGIEAVIERANRLL